MVWGDIPMPRLTTGGDKTVRGRERHFSGTFVHSRFGIAPATAERLGSAGTSQPIRRSSDLARLTLRASTPNRSEMNAVVQPPRTCNSLPRHQTLSIRYPRTVAASDGVAETANRRSIGRGTGRRRSRMPGFRESPFRNWTSSTGAFASDSGPVAKMGGELVSVTSPTDSNRDNAPRTSRSLVPPTMPRSSFNSSPRVGTRIKPPRPLRLRMREAASLRSATS